MLDWVIYREELWQLMVRAFSEGSQGRCRRSFSGGLASSLVLGLICRRSEQVGVLNRLAGLGRGLEGFRVSDMFFLDHVWTEDDQRLLTVGRSLEAESFFA